MAEITAELICEYGIVDWVTITAAVDCLFSEGTYDPYFDILQHAFDMGGHTDISVCIGDGVVVLTAFKFRSRLGMFKFKQDYLKS